MPVNLNVKNRYQAILSYTGLMLLLGGLLMLTPLLALIGKPGEWKDGLGFLIPALSLLVLGAVMWKLLRRRDGVILTVQDGGVIVLISWVVVCLFSAWPFMMIQGLNFTQAVFEAVSGWTTTGLSVVDVTAATHQILLWRSIIQLAGGAGLAIIMLAAIAGPIGPGLYVAEGRSEQLVPHVRESAKIVLVIYSGYVLVGILAYRLAGMTFFDAINHSFTALSTGGFSTHVESIGYWNSVAVEAVTIVLILMGNLNFLTAFLFLHGKFKAVSRNGEMRLMAALIPASAFVLFLLTSRSIYPTLGQGIRTAVFETVAALTTTGFTITSYAHWNAFGMLVLTVLMLVGGGTCSTAGGIKQYRIYLLVKSIWWEMRRPFLPRTAVVENYVWQGERKDFITSGRIRQVANFVFLYLAVYFIGSAIIVAHGFGLKESLLEFASALGTTGLSSGVTAANAPPVVLWTETLGMFLGRLEIFVAFIGAGIIARDIFSLFHRR